MYFEVNEIATVSPTCSTAFILKPYLWPPGVYSSLGTYVFITPPDFYSRVTLLWKSTCENTYIFYFIIIPDGWGMSLHTWHVGPLKLGANWLGWLSQYEKTVSLHGVIHRIHCLGFDMFVVIGKAASILHTWHIYSSWWDVLMGELPSTFRAVPLKTFCFYYVQRIFQNMYYNGTYLLLLQQLSN